MTRELMLKALSDLPFALIWPGNWEDSKRSIRVPLHVTGCSCSPDKCYLFFRIRSGSAGDHGSRSSKNDRLWSSICSGILFSRCSKYSNGFSPFAFAVSAML